MTSSTKRILIVGFASAVLLCGILSASAVFAKTDAKAPQTAAQILSRSRYAMSHVAAYHFVVRQSLPVPMEQIESGVGYSVSLFRVALGPPSARRSSSGSRADNTTEAGSLPGLSWCKSAPRRQCAGRGTSRGFAASRRPFQVPPASLDTPETNSASYAGKPDLTEDRYGDCESPRRAKTSLCL